MERIPRDFLFFVGAEWTALSQRGQSLALECAARGHRVFYCEPMLSLPKAVSWLLRGEGLKAPNPGHPGLTVLRPKMSLWRFRGSRFAAFDRALFRRWWRRVRLAHGIRDDAILYVNMPYWWGNILSANDVAHSKLIYDCIDDCKIYSHDGRVLKLMQEAERDICERADVILATAGALKEKLSPYGDRVHLLSNGVDSERFWAARGEGGRPKDLVDLPRPIFGFVGALFYWIDYDAIEALANAYPSASVVLVGPTDQSFPVARVRRCPNIHLLGPRAYEQVPGYVNAFDVCLNPFRMGPLGDTINPLKLYEYLALGKPVISARTRETERFGEVVYLYGSREELVAVARRALEESGERCEERRSVAAANSWGAKMDDVEALLWPGRPGESS